MFFKRHTQTNFVAESFPVLDQDIARCVVDISGTILYANNSFMALVDNDILTGMNIGDCLDLNAMSGYNHGDLSGITDGLYDIRIAGNPIRSAFYFDWFTRSNGVRALVIGAAQDGQEKRDDQKWTEIMKSLQGFSAQTTLQDNTISFVTPDPQGAVLGDQDFLSFAEMTHDVMVISDLAGNILKTNNTFVRNFLREGEKANQFSLIDLFSPEDTAQIRNAIHTLAHEGPISPEKTLNFESRLINRKGESRWVEWRQKYVNGKIYSSGRDITDIRKKHDALLKRQKQLSEAEAIGRMGHWHWLIGEEDVSWSEEIYRIFGLDSHDFTPNIDTISAHVHKRDVSRLGQVFQRAMIEEKNYDMEFRILRPGGEVRFIRLEGRCEKDENGEVIALYGIMQDMTERMIYELELKEAKKASEQAYAAKSRFLANMSHELRTPLNAIIGFSEMMVGQMLGPIFNEKYLDYAGSIKESGEHLLDLISDILDMSKIEAGKYTLEPEEVELKGLIRRAVTMIEARAQEQGIRLRTNVLDGDPLIVSADRRAITQIFANLLSNAIKFTKKGGQVWLEMECAQDNVVVRVCDNGIGIPPAKLATVLRPFEQVSNEFTRDHEGTGLGLSITKELIELHGGTMLIDSAVDIGTTVSIRLPL